MVAKSPQGIALPLVILVLAALGLLSALGLSDALAASRVAALAEDRVRAQGAALAGTALLLAPPDLPWLCLQPPNSAQLLAVAAAAGARTELRWWAVAPGRIRAEITGVGRTGAKHRRLANLVPDSLPADSAIPGCPDAVSLRPAGTGWLMPHPEG